MEKKITIYSCSGCSNLAQLSNSIAVKLHREKIATMSCIAGVGGDVAPLVKVAEQAEVIMALDGCPLICVQKCLSRHNIMPDKHIIMTDLNLKKNIFDEVSPQEFDMALGHVLEELRSLKEKNR
jgi:uncharacterized metal-binding protein